MTDKILIGASCFLILLSVVMLGSSMAQSQELNVEWVQADCELIFDKSQCDRFPLVGKRAFDVYDFAISVLLSSDLPTANRQLELLLDKLTGVSI
jgi:hypothetical protein